MAHFSAVRGSISPTLDDDLIDAAGNAQDLTGASVTLRLQHASTGGLLSFPMTVDADPTTGRVYRDWQPGDLDVAVGRYWGQYLVDYGGGEVEIWPSQCEDGPGLDFRICPAIPAP